MSNQASEDALKEITKILLMYKARLAYEQVEPQHEWLGSIDIEEAKLDLLAIIRTEKLKLLAEVRERVVGEPIPHDWDDDIEDMTKWKYYTGYKSNADDFVAGYNRSRAERLEQLTKLEAEL